MAGNTTGLEQIHSGPDMMLIWYHDTHVLPMCIVCLYCRDTIGKSAMVAYYQ